MNSAMESGVVSTRSSFCVSFFTIWVISSFEGAGNASVRRFSGFGDFESFHFSTYRSAVARGMFSWRKKSVHLPARPVCANSCLYAWRRSANIRLVVEDVVGSFGLAACNELPTNDDPALSEADFLPHLSDTIPARTNHGGGDKFRADIAFS